MDRPNPGVNNKTLNDTSCVCPSQGFHTGIGGVCPTGHYCPRASDLPQPCMAGSYADEEAMESCKLCPEGFYCTTNTTDFLLMPCETGEFSGNLENASIWLRDTNNLIHIGFARHFLPSISLSSLCFKVTFVLTVPSTAPSTPVPLVLTTPSRGVPPSTTAWIALGAITVRVMEILLQRATVVQGGTALGVRRDLTQPPMVGNVSRDTTVQSVSSLPKLGWSRALVRGKVCQTMLVFISKKKNYHVLNSAFRTNNNVSLVLAGSSDPQPCPGGQYCQFAGLDTPTGNCSSGYYCTARSSSATPVDGTTGDICPAGFYCEEGVAWPTPCSPGTYSPSTGNVDVSDCIACDFGEYCGDYNLTATSGE